MATASRDQDHTQSSSFISTHRYKADILLSCSLVLGLPACSTLPTQTDQPSQMVFESATSLTRLAQILGPLPDQNIGLTGDRVLYDPLEALAARMQLIHQAERTLDLQYYIWDNHRIGALALHGFI